MSIADEMSAIARAAAEQTATKVLGGLEELVRRAVTQALEARDDDSLKPLHKILGGTADAARMRLLRDPELAKLGVVVGAYVFASGKHKGTRAERLQFRPSEVRALLQSRKKGGVSAPHIRTAR